MALDFCKTLELFRRAGPVVFQQAREGAIGEEFATGLAGGTVVRFV